VDRDLVEAAKHGDRDAYVDLIRVRSDRLFAIAQRILRDIDRAEDALQDALVIAWRDLRGLRDSDRFDAWHSACSSMSASPKRRASAVGGGRPYRTATATTRMALPVLEEATDERSASEHRRDGGGHCHRGGRVRHPATEWIGRRWRSATDTLHQPTQPDPESISAHVQMADDPPRRDIRDRFHLGRADRRDVHRP
jgi:hypothetical protein